MNGRVHAYDPGTHDGDGDPLGRTHVTHLTPLPYRARNPCHVTSVAIEPWTRMPASRVIWSDPDFSVGLPESGWCEPRLSRRPFPPRSMWGQMS